MASNQCAVHPDGTFECVTDPSAPCFEAEDGKMHCAPSAQTTSPTGAKIASPMVYVGVIVLGLVAMLPVIVFLFMSRKK